MLGWLVSLALVVQGERVLVAGQRYQNVVFQGAPWQPGRSWIEGRGKGNALYADLALGLGDFEIRARLAIEEGEGAQPSLVLGDRTIDLDSKRVPRKRPVDVLVVSSAGRMRLEVDGQSVLEEEAPAAAVGRFGLAPGVVLVKVYQLALIGNLEPMPDRALPPDFQAGIDAALERGVAYLLSRQMRDGSWQNATASFAEGQTALATYALLRSGLTSKHPSVARALAHLAEVEPTETYPAGLMLMAFEATGDPAWRPKMRSIVRELLAWQATSGWSYAPAPREGAVYRDAIPTTDLSNTQYAVLGLRAADHAGVEVPAEAWSRALTSTLAHQESAFEIEIPRRDGRTGTEKVAIAGFRYRPDREVTASMTSAGCAILHVCREALGRSIKAQRAVETARAIELGQAWLDAHWNLEENFGSGEPQNFYYYLYGLERIGTLLEIETIGGHAWYSEGAQMLLRKQDANGSWVVGGYAPTEWREIPAEHDTCFAILFLKRASRPSVRTGETKAAPVSREEKLEPWMMGAAARSRRNLLLEQAVTATASSVHSAGEDAGHALDGQESTLWTCEASDGAPSLVLEWKKPIEAESLVLSGACSRRADLGKYDRIRRVQVRLDRKKDPIEVEVPKRDGSELEPIVVPFPAGTQVRRIEIRIVEREAGGEHKGRAGFSEVALEREP
ncbi:MAG: hypothetical protein ACKVXR_18060 [Planctomycetota bacterium]